MRQPDTMDSVVTVIFAQVLSWAVSLSVLGMASDRVDKLSFAQMAKSLLRFNGKTKTKERHEEPTRKHQDLRKTLSLSSQCIGSTHGVQFGQDLEGHKNVKDAGKVPLFKTGNSLKPKYHSQKIKSRKNTNQNTVPYYLSKPEENMKQLAEKLGRRKFSLKVVGGGNLRRQQHNLSCPDLVG